MIIAYGEAQCTYFLFLQVFMEKFS